MAVTGQQLLSKIIDEGSTQALAKYNVKRTDFPSRIEQTAYDFVVSYAESNGGAAPSLATFVDNNPQITYIPEVTDSYEYLAGQLKDAVGKREFAEYINSPEFTRSYETLPTDSFLNSLTERLARIKMETRTGVPEKVGNSLSDIGEMFTHEYEQRKAGKSFKLWRTPFESLNEEIGGLYSGDVYGIMAESGRGKTYLSEVVVDALLRQGANVFVKSYEVKWYSWIARLFSIATAYEEVLTDDRGVKVGVPNKGLLSGALESEIEAYILDFAAKINEYYPGNLVLQAKGDPELTRTLDELDRELADHPEIDVVVIDPFYGLSDVYGRNSNKTTGGAAEQAARRLETIIGAHDVVGIYTIQAHTEKQDTEDGEAREVKLPKRDRVKTTTAVLEIATNLFAFDAANGVGKLGVEKGRNGGEGFVIELLALMDYGVLREPDRRTQAGQFAGVSGF
ncbi:AAA family ATPase [Paenibacillus xylanexedens]|uniref:AAA family ATPase n=1 Tax=Paenibacillus xylanexedens TaxID=528191 RepID=UPI0011A0E8E6|nr:AAA family ATPase [Paenibacillus xylanexedens]